MGKIDLHPAVDDLIEHVAGNEKIEKIILFGSRARGDAMPRADVDLAIDAPHLDKKEWLDILNLVEQAPTLLKIDCLWLQEQTGALREAILREGKILYEVQKP